MDMGPLNDRLVANGQLESRVAEAPPRWLKNFARTIGTTAVVAGLIMVACMAIAFVKY